MLQLISITTLQKIVVLPPFPIYSLQCHQTIAWLTYLHLTSLCLFSVKYFGRGTIRKRKLFIMIDVFMSFNVSNVLLIIKRLSKCYFTTLLSNQGISFA